MSRRLFVAAELDGAARAACAGVASRLRATGWPARWVPAENYHLTLAFLGAVDADRVEHVVHAVADVTQSVTAVAVPLDAVGAFPNAARPRVAWVGPARAVPQFGTLCGVVRSALSAHGFSFDPKAGAHVTLARSDGRTALPVVPPPAGARVLIERLTLFESITGRDGVRYVALERFPTSTPAGPPSF